MAVAATGVVIYDPLNGSNDNAGYFDASLASAGTDYPRTQAAAILTATDLACTAGSTTLTSGTGGFTDAMIGNGIYIKSGTHFRVGLYVITGRTDTNTVTLDRDPTDGSDASSGTGSVGGRRAVLLDAWLETPYNVAGMTHEIWATGTMTLTENLSPSLSATAAAPITLRGMSSTGTTSPNGDDRPLLACGAYGVTIAAYWVCENIRFTGTANPVITLGTSSLIRNCKIVHSGAGGTTAISSNSYVPRIVDCEISHPNGRGINLTGYAPRILYTYVHDCSQGGILVYYYAAICFCIIDNCGTMGINPIGSPRLGVLCLHNTIDGCTDGIAVETHYAGTFLNNIISNCTSEGVVATSAVRNNYWDYNNFYNNGTDRTNVDAGPNDTTGDPDFVNATGGDFSLDTGTECDDTGFGIRLGVG